MTKADLGQRIKIQREAIGWTQEELANRFGVQQATMSQYETGKRGIEATDLDRLAQILGVNVGYFFTKDKPPTLVVDIDAEGNITRTQAITSDDAAEIKEELRAIRETLRKIEEKTGNTK